MARTAATSPRSTASQVRSVRGLICEFLEAIYDERSSARRNMLRRAMTAQVLEGSSFG
jgi:hypothetical protein